MSGGCCGSIELDDDVEVEVPLALVPDASPAALYEDDDVVACVGLPVGGAAVVAAAAAVGAAAAATVVGGGMTALLEPFPEPAAGIPPPTAAAAAGAAGCLPSQTVPCEGAKSALSEFSLEASSS